MQDRYSQIDEILLRRRPEVKADIEILLAYVRSTPESGRPSALSMFLKRQKRTRKTHYGLKSDVE
jgi:hypothetical protein